ncbi:MAG: SrfA family protein, partial [Comamonas sp.]
MGQSAAAVASSQASALGKDEQAVRLQPVLTFWGFVNHEADRHRKPLYFLEPIPEKSPVVPSSVAGAVPLVEAVPSATEPVVTPHVLAEPSKVLPPVAVAQPWWKRWWLWLLLALLLLLLLWLLRGCMPTAKLPAFGGVQLPHPSLPSLPAGQLPDINLPNGGLPTAQLPGLPAGQMVAGTAGMNAAGAGLVPEGEGYGGDPAQQSGLPVGVEPDAGQEPPATASEPPLLPEAPTAETPPVPPELPAQAGAEPTATPAPLEIPEKAADGVADFLNGNYRTRGGLVDKDTAQPLRLEYAFENGKGQVEIQRPNGVSCKGNVLASMKGGQLGIDSQGAAKCSDGSVYDMPQVQCKPGAKSAADCAGVYDNRQFPI